MLVAKTAILLGFHTVGVILFFFHSLVIALFAIYTGKGNFCAHGYPLSHAAVAAL